MNSRNLAPKPRLTADQTDMLIGIIREESGDKVSRPDFNETVLLAFENIAGFETLSTRESTRLLVALWQEYRATCRSRK